MALTSTNLILKVLDGLSLRATVTAQNIANANTPNYRPMRVSFEEALLQTVKGRATSIENVQPQIMVAGDKEAGAEMRLDLELATASATAGRYGSLVEVLNRQLQIQALAASGIR